MRLIAHAYTFQLDDEKFGAWSLACGRLGQAKSCARWSLAGAASGRPLDRDSEVIGSTGELPAAAAASGRPPDCDPTKSKIDTHPDAESESAAAAASGRPLDCDPTKSKIDTDTESESESLNTNVGATERERERDRERDRGVQDIPGPFSRGS